MFEGLRCGKRRSVGAAALVLAVLGSAACGSEQNSSVDFKDPFWLSPPLVDYTSKDYLAQVDKVANGSDSWEKVDSHCFGSVTERDLAAVRVQAAIDRDDQARQLKQLPEQTLSSLRAPTPTLLAANESDPGARGHDPAQCFTVVYSNKSLPDRR
ncbi:Uncharacterised protein [Mycobacteroides abscessus]|uniref:hypothetical protein n=1 Tax=Mycobacteroides abscessus TaxID=36809 RepID=UPI0005E61256|nr:hypothetical protein [Mycobacteroides abscessus]MBN7315316.1 hypothetical protein [Mycobacteroides abscessus subsp. massiliense]CPU58177.1 Uncharacterised protein [Mycobacteroides abscessus]CPX34511.1 Uncharacterised protein [Mycobacteroides abscessus]CPZ48854.1 Uncharacterised protein [Mycobacteroides abscessus]